MVGASFMGDLSRWKAAAVLALTLGVCLAAVPNILPQNVFERLPAWAQRKVVLSYDLQGGTRTVAVVSRDGVRKEKVEQLREDVRRVLREVRPVICFLPPVPRNNGVDVRILEGSNVQQAVTKLRELAGPIAVPAEAGARRPTKLADVPAGSASVTADRATPATAMSPDFTVTARDDGLITLTLTDALLDERIAQARWQAMQIIERRLHESGAVKFSVQPQGFDRIVIEAIGVDNRWRFILG
jgi:preprotein translocase subunit SecD